MSKILDFFSLGKGRPAKPAARPTRCHCGAPSVRAASNLELFPEGELFRLGYCEDCFEGLRTFHSVRKLLFQEKQAA